MRLHVPCRPRKSAIFIIAVLFTLLYFTTDSLRHLTVRIQYLMDPSTSIFCYRLNESSIENIANVQVRKGKSIFFHETSCNSHLTGKITINARQACAVESAARQNPKLDVYLLYTSPGVFKFENTTSDKLLEVLLGYKNIKILHVNYENYTQGTSVENLYASGKIELSKYVHSHASDILRYVSLYKYGGIYLDLDVVVMKNLGKLGPNFAGAESESMVAAGVMGFSHDGIGHEYAADCLDDLRDHFNGRAWGDNGPGIITRLAKKLCNASVAYQMTQHKCKNFTVYGPQVFYGIPYWEWESFFHLENYGDVLIMTNHSYVIHVWNNYSREKTLQVRQRTPYIRFAEKYCPKSLKASGEYF